MEGETFSARGKCERCGAGEAANAIVQMTLHHGPHFEQWRRSMAASVGGVLVDDARNAE
jgi:hypothetical protein